MEKPLPAVKAAFQKVMPVLRVADLQRAIDWYTNRLHFEVSWRAAPDAGGETCMLLAGEISVLLSTGAHLGGDPMFTGALYFEMEGVAEYYGTVKDSVEVVWPLDVMEYGTLEFGVRDADGYLLAFVQQAGPDAA